MWVCSMVHYPYCYQGQLVAGDNPYDKYLKQIEVAGKSYKYYDLPAIGQDFGVFSFTYVLNY